MASSLSVGYPSQGAENPLESLPIALNADSSTLDRAPAFNFWAWPCLLRKMAAQAVLSLGAMLGSASDPGARRQAVQAVLSLGASMILDALSSTANRADRVELLRLLRSVALNAPPTLRVEQAAQFILGLIKLSGSCPDAQDAIVGALSAWAGALAAVDAHSAALFFLDMSDTLEDCRALWFALLEVRRRR